MVAFARSGGLAVVVPRLVVGLGDDWAGTTVELPAGAWRDVITGDRRDGRRDGQRERRRRCCGGSPSPCWAGKR